MKLEPSLSTLQAQIELRVLLGSQAGSRLTLAPGQYDLGLGDECEVILNGPKMEELHARLSFDGEHCSITPVGGKVCDAHGNEIQGDYPLAPGAPLEIGGIWICVDEVDADWPDPADVVPIMPAPPQAPRSDEPSQAMATAASDLSSDQPRLRARMLLIVCSTALGIVGLAGIGLAAWVVSGDSAQNNQTLPSELALPDPPNLSKVRQIVSTSAAGSFLEIAVTARRQIVVKGFVPDATTKARLAAALGALSPPPQMDLQVDFELMERASKLLAERMDVSRAKLKVDGVSGGVLSLQGAVATQAARDSVMDLLQAGVPGLRSINASVVLAEDLPQILQDQLISEGLLKKMQIVDRQPEFVLRGLLNDEEMRRWESLIINFVDRYGKLLPVRATIRTAQSKPPVQVQAIIGGSTPFVITEDGERITRGGEVKGNKLVIVRDSEIIFEGSERFKISR